MARPRLRLIDGGRADGAPAEPWAIEFARQLARQDVAVMMRGMKVDSRGQK